MVPTTTVLLLGKESSGSTLLRLRSRTERNSSSLLSPRKTETVLETNSNQNQIKFKEH